MRSTLLTPPGGEAVGADAFFHCPVDGDAAVHRFDEVAGDGAEGGVAEDLDGAVIDAEGVVEGELVFGEAEGFAALGGGNRADMRAGIW